MRYVTFRRNYTPLLLGLMACLLMVSALVWRYAPLVLFGLIGLLSVIEYILVKCPNCKRRPGRFFMQFPRKCRHCGKEF